MVVLHTSRGAAPSCSRTRLPALTLVTLPTLIPCSECLLIDFVPAELKDQVSPCRLIPLTPKGETADYFYRCGTQLELEEALTGWLRDQINQIEEQRERASKAEPATASPNELDGLHRKQWVVFANNLYLLASRHRDNDNYLVAHALYGRALEAAEKVAASEAASYSRHGSATISKPYTRFCAGDRITRRKSSRKNHM